MKVDSLVQGFLQFSFRGFYGYLGVQAPNPVRTRSNRSLQERFKHVRTNILPICETENAILCLLTAKSLYTHGIYLLMIIGDGIRGIRLKNTPPPN